MSNSLAGIRFGAPSGLMMCGVGTHYRRVSYAAVEIFVGKKSGVKMLWERSDYCIK